MGLFDGKTVVLRKLRTSWKVTNGNSELVQTFLSILNSCNTEVPTHRFLLTPRFVVGQMLFGIKNGASHVRECLISHLESKEGELTHMVGFIIKLSKPDLYKPTKNYFKKFLLM